MQVLFLSHLFVRLHWPSKNIVHMLYLFCQMANILIRLYHRCFDLQKCVVVFSDELHLAHQWRKLPFEKLNTTYKI